MSGSYSFIIAAFVTASLIYVLAKLAPRLGLIDIPGGHRTHSRGTPLIGGLAMFCGFLFAVLSLDVPLSGFRTLFAGSALLVVIGVLDDMHELSTRWRFLTQITAACLMVYGGNVVLLDLGNLVSDNILGLGRWSIPLTVFATVGVINALNMSDGLDGQAGCIVMIALGYMLIFLLGTDHTVDLGLLLVLIVVVSTFLVFNFPMPWRSNARTFMGDAGSMFLGFVLSWFFISLSQGENRAFSPVMALWIFALPLFDTVTVMTRRIIYRSSPFIADRTHYHHILEALGYKKFGALVIIFVMSTAMGGAGYFGSEFVIADSSMFYGFILTFFAYFLLTTFYVKKLGLDVVVPAGVVVERRYGVTNRRQGDRRNSMERRFGEIDRRRGGGRP